MRSMRSRGPGIVSGWPGSADRRFAALRQLGGRRCGVGQRRDEERSRRRSEDLCASAASSAHSPSGRSSRVMCLRFTGRSRVATVFFSTSPAGAVAAMRRCVGVGGVALGGDSGRRLRRSRCPCGDHAGFQPSTNRHLLICNWTCTLGGARPVRQGERHAGMGFLTGPGSSSGWCRPPSGQVQVVEAVDKGPAHTIGGLSGSRPMSVDGLHTSRRFDRRSRRTARSGRSLLLIGAAACQAALRGEVRRMSGCSGDDARPERHPFRRVGHVGGHVELEVNLDRAFRMPAYMRTLKPS